VHVSVIKVGVFPAVKSMHVQISSACMPKFQVHTCSDLKCVHAQISSVCMHQVRACSACVCVCAGTASPKAGRVSVIDSGGASPRHRAHVNIPAPCGPGPPASRAPNTGVCTACTHSPTACTHPPTACTHSPTACTHSPTLHARTPQPHARTPQLHARHALAKCMHVLAARTHSHTQTAPTRALPICMPPCVCRSLSVSPTAVQIKDKRDTEEMREEKRKKSLEGRGERVTRWLRHR